MAALNHPGIAAIYEFNQCDQVRYLVLELVEGETLARHAAALGRGTGRGTSGWFEDLKQRVPTRCVPDEDNQKWLADMKVLVDQIEAGTAFAAIDYLTVRDDAPKAVRDAATEELRTLVATHESAGRRVLIVPLLLSYGGIEKGIRQRLEGLNYVMATRALMPDSRLADWVRQAVAK